MRLVLTNILLISLLVLSGCSPKQPPAKADFRATDTPSRVPAIVGAADEKEQASLSELVHALSDKDPAIRLFAIQSLQERTGQTMGYRYYEATDKRQAAADRWHAWLNDQTATTRVLPDSEDTSE